jgi:hypothetical protein
MARRSIGEIHSLMQWPCTLVEGGRVMVVLYIYIYYHVCCMYSIFNGIIDSSKVRAQKAAQLSQISGSSYVPRRSKEQLEIVQLKESLRQRDEYYTTCLAQQQAILQVS